jgi:hypothetical protein
MIRADNAQLSWDVQKKRWSVRIQTGEEVIKRPSPGTPQNASDEVLRSVAVQVASDDGYEVNPSQVTIER